MPHVLPSPLGWRSGELAERSESALNRRPGLAGSTARVEWWPDNLDQPIPDGAVPARADRSKDLLRGHQVEESEEDLSHVIWIQRGNVIADTFR